MVRIDQIFQKKREILGILFRTSVISETRQKSHCSINGKVAPFSMQKLSTPLEIIFAEKKSKTIYDTQWKKFLIS